MRLVTGFLPEEAGKGHACHSDHSGAVFSKPGKSLLDILPWAEDTLCVSHASQKPVTVWVVL